MAEGESLEPKAIGKYEIEATLGSGSMGVVYRARDPEIGRIVAIKTLRNVYLGDDSNSEAMQRFRQESRSAGKLRHPNIVTVFEAGRTETGTPYIVMEFVDGRSLEDVIREDSPIDPAEALNWIALVGSAIDYAHAQGVIHRDIKPSNVILDSRGNPFLLDFGVAKLTDTSLTPAGMVVGTPSYMAPEQIRGEQLDGGTDLFALAVMTFELLSGKRPFPGADFTSVVSSIIHQPPLTLAECGQGALPAELNVAIAKALSKSRGERQRSCLEFLADCGNALGIRIDGAGVAGYRPGVGWTTLRRPVIEQSAGAPSAEPAPTTSIRSTPTPSSTTAVQHPETPAEEPWRDSRKGSGSSFYAIVFVLFVLAGAGAVYVLAPQVLRSQRNNAEPIELSAAVDEAVVEEPQVVEPIEHPVSAVELTPPTTIAAAAPVVQVTESVPTSTPAASDFLSQTLDPKTLVQNIQTADADSSLPQLIVLARHSDYTVRVAVLKALVHGSNLRSREVLRLMVDALNDDEFIVRGFAVKTIASLNNEAALRLLEKRRDVEQHPVVMKVLDESIRKLAGEQNKL